MRLTINDKEIHLPTLRVNMFICPGEGRFPDSLSFGFDLDPLLDVQISMDWQRPRPAQLDFFFPPYAHSRNTFKWR